MDNFPTASCPNNVGKMFNMRAQNQDYDNTDSMLCPHGQPDAANKWCNVQTGSWQWECERAGQKPAGAVCGNTEHWEVTRQGTAPPDIRRWYQDNPKNSLNIV